MEVFSQRLLALRSHRGLSQSAVARAVGLGLRAYQYYEHGEREPQLSTLVKMADFYEVSLDYLAGRSETRERQP